MIEKIPFGRTAHLSTRVIFGSYALAYLTQKDSDPLLDLLLANDINHIDTAASYGEAELRLGPWMARHRGNFFLATKTELRTYAAAKEELHRSLERLKVDHVDLWQIHNLSDPQEWETTFGPGGALEAFIEAREQGLTRFIGVTGHGLRIPEMHLKSLQRYDFDSVLLPYNYALMQKSAYVSAFESLMTECKKRGTAVQTIKSLTRRPWGEHTATHNTWYEPYTEQPDIDKAVHWVLGQPEIFLITAGDQVLLPKIIEAAHRHQQRPGGAEMDVWAEKTGMASLFD